VTWYTTQIVNQFGRPAMDAFPKALRIRVNFVRADSIELAARMLNEARPVGRRRRIRRHRDGARRQESRPRPQVAADRARQWPKEYWDSEEYGSPPTCSFIPPPTTPTWCQGGEPRSFRDLLDRKWRGKMAWATHATSSGAVGFIGVVLAEMGEAPGKAYLRELARQDIIQLGVSARTVVDHPSPANIRWFCRSSIISR